jgi:hypothetical protein
MTDIAQVNPDETTTHASVAESFEQSGQNLTDNLSTEDDVQVIVTFLSES